MNGVVVVAVFFVVGGSRRLLVGIYLDGDDQDRYKSTMYLVLYFKLLGNLRATKQNGCFYF